MKRRDAGVLDDRLSCLCWMIMCFGQFRNAFRYALLFDGSSWVRVAGFAG